MSDNGISCTCTCSVQISSDATYLHCEREKNEQSSDLSSFFLLASLVFDNFKTPTLAIQISNAQNIYDRVSDVVESCVKFANKILTHHRMH